MIFALFAALAALAGAWYLVSSWLTPGLQGEANLLRALTLFTIVAALGVWRLVQIIEQRK